MVVSWGATAQRAGEAWLAHEVPRAYVERTARAARQRLAAQRAAIRQAAAVPDARAMESVDALATAVGRLEAAGAADDRDSAAQAVRAIARAVEMLRPLAARKGGV